MKRVIMHCHDLDVKGTVREGTKEIGGFFLGRTRLDFKYCNPCVAKLFEYGKLKHKLIEGIGSWGSQLFPHSLLSISFGVG